MEPTKMSLVTPPPPVNTIVVDFETYYAKDYTLRGMTLSSYIQDERFQVIGFSVKLNDEVTQWHSDPATFSIVLRSLPWDTATGVAHNAMFDMSILAWHYGIHPQRIFCTMMGSRVNIVPFSHRMSLDKVAKHLTCGLVKGTAVHSAMGKRREDFYPTELRSYGDYCDTDTEICRFIYDRVAPGLTEHDREMLHLTIRKFTCPQLVLDVDLLNATLLAVKENKRKLLKATGLDTRDALMSNNQLAALLEKFGVKPPQKVSPKTGKIGFAFAKTDKGMKELAEHSNPHVQALAAARLGHKSTLEETRLQRLLDVAEGTPEHYLPFPLLFYGAHTGRLSGYDKLNLQNANRGGAIRQAIRAPEGCSLVVGDLSQIEARMLAWWAGEDKLVAAFAKGEDVYSLFASKLYLRPINKDDDPKQRFVGKTGILGLGFGCGAIKFQTMLDNANIVLDDGGLDAKDIVYAYRDEYTKIPKLWRYATQLIGAMVASSEGQMQTFGERCPITVIGQSLLLPGGRRLYYPELYQDADGDFHYKNNKNFWKKTYGAALVENIVQALAQVVIQGMELHMTKLLEGTGIYAAGQVHDEMIYCVPDAHAEKIKRVMTHVMSTPPDWCANLPLACEVDIGKTYGDAK